MDPFGDGINGKMITFTGLIGPVFSFPHYKLFSLSLSQCAYITERCLIILTGAIKISLPGFFLFNNRRRIKCLKFIYLGFFLRSLHASGFMIYSFSIFYPHF